MLYIVLLLVAAALAGVVAALITANSLWAWISIGLSALAGIVLLVDWFRRRSGAPSGGTATPAAEPSPAGAAENPQASEEAEVEGAEDESAEDEAAESAAEPEAAQASADDGETAKPAEEVAEEPAATAGDGLPGEEQTDAADALIVSDLDTEVLVVDEYPRYHVRECSWLSDRSTIPIAVSEAHELGFSPCAQCGPDAALAAEHREAREKFSTRADG